MRIFRVHFVTTRLLGVEGCRPVCGKSGRTYRVTNVAADVTCARCLARLRKDPTHG